MTHCGEQHRDFTARRLIRDAFAVRERLGDPRAVPGFRCPFRPGMPSSTTPGSSRIDKFQSSDVDMAFAESRPARHSQNSRNPFHAGDDFRGFLVHTVATACQLARLPERI